MSNVGTTVTEMNALVDGVGGGDITGLSQMAERLRSEATGFPAGMRR